MKLHDLAVALDALTAKVTALIAAPNAPPAPVVLAVVFFDSTTINLDWGDAPPTGLISYTVYRSISDLAFVPFPPFTGSPPASNLSDGGLTPGTKYSYYVVSTNSFGTSAPSNVVTRTTTGADTTPDQFVFVDQTNVALSTVITSAPITVTGINAAAVISIVGGSYSINGGAFVTASGTVNNNDQVRARNTSSGSNGTAVNTIVTIGGVSDTFTSTTVATGTTTVDVAPFTMTSVIGGTSLPFTFGHAFKQGEIGGPGGAATPYVTSDAAAVQAIPITRWPDGSLKFAAISVRQNLPANSPSSIMIRKTSAGPSGVDIQEPLASDYQNGTYSILVTLSGVGAGNYRPDVARANGITPWDRTTARKVREFTGPVMSEFHYYSPTSDPHITIWWYVRVYSDRAEVETVIENGWLNVLSPATKSYNVTVTLGGVIKYGPAAPVTHYHHGRWSRVDWIGADPQITPAHDTAYLRSTKLVPNYGWTSPTSAAYSAGWTTATNPAPFATGTVPNNYGQDTGGQEWIALLPQWDALYCAAANVTTYRTTLGESRIMGRFGQHFRDETTGRPIDYRGKPPTSGFSQLVIKADPGSSYPIDATNGPQDFEIPHHGAFGYMAYLVSARWTMLEELQMVANAAFLRADRVAAGVVLPNNGVHSMRGAAWTWRSLGLAAAISPTEVVGDTAVQAGFASAIEATMTYLKTNNVDIGGTSAATGDLGQYHENNTVNGDGNWWNRNWMQSFQVLALAYLSDLGIPNITQSTLTAVRDHAYKAIIRMFVPGTNAQWNWRHAAEYDIPYQTGANVLMTTAQSYAAYTAVFGTLADNAASLAYYDGNSTVEKPGGGGTDPGQGYVMYKIAALNWANEHGIANAAAAYNTLAQATNLPVEFPPIQSTDWWHNDPRWAIVSRTAIPSSTNPAWINSLTTVGRWENAPNGFLPTTGGVISAASQGPPVHGATGVTSVVNKWSGGACSRSGDVYLFGGGHQDYGGNEVYRYRGSHDSPGWQRISDPSLAAAFDETNPNNGYYSDNTPKSRHSGDQNTFDDTDNTLRSVGASFVYSSNATGSYSMIGMPIPSGILTDTSVVTSVKGVWSAPGTYANSPSTIPEVVTDPATGNIYAIAVDPSNKINIHKWTKGVPGSWALIGNLPSIEYTSGQVLALDYDLMHLYIIGGGNAATNHGYRMTLSNNSITDLTSTGSGAAWSTVMNSNLWGVYVPANGALPKSIFCAKSDPSTGALTIYQINITNPNAPVATVYATTGISLPAVDPGDGSMKSRLFYSPNLKGLLFIPQWGQLYYLRLYA